MFDLCFLFISSRMIQRFLPQILCKFSLSSIPI